MLRGVFVRERDRLVERIDDHRAASRVEGSARDLLTVEDSELLLQLLPYPLGQVLRGGQQNRGG